MTSGREEPGEAVAATDPGGRPNDPVVRVAVVGTVTFVAAAMAATVWPDALAVPAAVLDLALFAVGCAAFVWSFLRVVGRSRREVVSVPGTWFLTGEVAPAAVRRVLLGAVAVQSVVALVTASIRPFTPLAFGILVPTFGLGFCGVWAARYGTFPTRSR
jgi:hypothetical protein